MHNGEEVINLLTKSQRIFSDISMYFQYRVPGSSSGEMCLILREWMDKMPQDHEFRCFVHNKRITGISQYHCYYPFEALQDREHAQRVRDEIVAYHDEIKDGLPLPSYVMDVVVFPDYSCHLIELNPFGSNMSSGAALFNWLTDEDLLYGRTGGGSDSAALPPIRILRELLPDAPAEPIVVL